VGTGFARHSAEPQHSTAAVNRITEEISMEATKHDESEIGEKPARPVHRSDAAAAPHNPTYFGLIGFSSPASR
jgi:hypothetical protein